jgi:flavin-binding protein dodecin
MSDHIYKLVELVGSSPSSIEDAIQNAIQKAAKTIEHINWFQVMETRGYVENGMVAHYQVILKVGFRVND